ncbi:hypothetical protein AB0D14_41985 [Streptomyces sp. NPDC048484]|uniref:hypothetical protein n=1 Tax=Streptomyces sp. NPDC048484 TaxID=3155146 RepID=UPI0034282E92
MVADATASLRERFAAADPGLLRLAAGLRAALGLALAALTALDQPSVVVLVGGFTAVVTSLGISDLHPRNQFRTLLAGPPVTFAALTAGALLAPFPLASRTVFLLLIFAAVYARRLGRRRLDLGIFAFMAYFLSQFADIQPHQLRPLTGALAIAFTAAAAAVARFGLVPATSYGILTRVSTAFDTRLRDARQTTQDLLADSTAGARRLRRRLERLHTSTLLIQEFLDEAPTAHPRDAMTELKRTARADAFAKPPVPSCTRSTPAAPNAPESASYSSTWKRLPSAREASPPKPYLLTLNA